MKAHCGPGCRWAELSAAKIGRIESPECLCASEPGCTCEVWSLASPDPSERCTCGQGLTCTCMLADMVEVGEVLVDQEATWIKEGTSLKESQATRANFSSSVTVKVTNFLTSPLAAVRTTTVAGEIEVPQCDVPSLGKEAVLCVRLTKPSTKSGCAGTANYRIGDTQDFLHIMWSSPNNFDKHASHLAIGITQERTNKFNDMYYQRPTWFARKYVYHDTSGLWFSCPQFVIYARAFTRPTSDVEVFVFPADPALLPAALEATVRAIQ